MATENFTFQNVATKHDKSEQHLPHSLVPPGIKTTLKDGKGTKMVWCTHMEYCLIVSTVCQ